MDEYSALLKLKRIYKVENKNTGRITEQDYIKNHMNSIRAEGQNMWNKDIAERYLDKLEQSSR